MFKQVLIMDSLAKELASLEKDVFERFDARVAHNIIGSMRHTVQEMIRQSYYTNPANTVTISYPMVEYCVPIMRRLASVEVTPTPLFYDVVGNRELEKEGSVCNLIYESAPHHDVVETFDRILCADLFLDQDTTNLILTQDDAQYFHSEVIIAMTRMVRNVRAVGHDSLTNAREALAKELFSFGGHINFQL